MYIERTIIEQLRLWKKRPDRKPLLLFGARQIGKTWVLKHFGETDFDAMAYFSFDEDSSLGDIFRTTKDPQRIIEQLSFLTDALIKPATTLIVFDEIQECPSARASLKFFKLDGRYDVICTGSLLGVNGYKTKEEAAEEANASIPVGFEQIVMMYPMDFEEWLWANGIEQQHTDYLRHCLERETPVSEGIHQRMRQLLLQYIVVGGMPERGADGAARHHRDLQGRHAEIRPTGRQTTHP